MTDLVKRLRELAQAATPGPWENHTGFVRSQGHGESVLAGNLHITTSTAWVAECRDGEAFYNWEANAAFIAAANPTAILSLLDTIETAEAKLRKMEEALREIIAADDDFRRSLSPNTDRDPLTLACDRARTALNHTPDGETA